MLITGLHHVSMKCCNDSEYKKTVYFYQNVLGLPIARMWAEGIMFQAGSCLVELFTNGEEPLPRGTIRHFALAASDVDACVDAVTAAGYEVFIGPKDITLPSNPPFSARIAFCRGPLGEEIEFFQERA